MNRSHVILSELWRSCKGDIDKLTEQERQAFNKAMWDHVDYMDRLKELYDALKAWGQAKEGKR